MKGELGEDGNTMTGEWTYPGGGYEFKGKRINMGQHSCSPAAGYFCPGQSLNLLVGDETGIYYFFERTNFKST